MREGNVSRYKEEDHHLKLGWGFIQNNGEEREERYSVNVLRLK